MHRKFEINLTKIKGSCHSGRQVVTYNSKSDLPIYRVNNLINSAFLGKNMHFSSITRIQSPNEDQMGDLSSISIMKRQRKEPRSQNSNTDISASGKQYVQIAHLLANGQICFANEKLPRKLPNQIVYARRFIDVINTYIMFLNHKYGNRNMSFRYM